MVSILLIAATSCKYLQSLWGWGCGSGACSAWGGGGIEGGEIAPFANPRPKASWSCYVEATNTEPSGWTWLRVVRQKNQISSVTHTPATCTHTRTCRDLLCFSNHLSWTSSSSDKSWLPAMTTLCAWGRLSSHFTNLATSEPPTTWARLLHTRVEEATHMGEATHTCGGGHAGCGD